MVVGGGRLWWWSVVGGGKWWWVVHHVFHTPLSPLMTMLTATRPIKMFGMPTCFGGAQQVAVNLVRITGAKTNLILFAFRTFCYRFIDI